MIEVHPLAAVFPMMTDDELQDLADDIAQHGLLHPIVLDTDGVLIDGRNRLRACEIAGVEPEFESLNGHDAAAFIVSANLSRRNLTKGQRAMALAMIYPDGGKGGRGKKGNPAETADFSERRLRDARSVLRHSRALAEGVLANRISLDKALEQVTEELEATASVDAQLSELRSVAPDLADLVDEERLALGEAYSAMKRRIADAEAAEANKRETMLRLSETAWRSTTAWASQEFLAEISERFADDEFRQQWLARVRPDPARIKEVTEGATALARFLILAVGKQHNV
jgi:ParB-like chromosome segregation protein Spo0J